MKIIVIKIPKNLVPNSLLSLFCPLVETKTKNQIFTKLENISVFCLQRVALYFKGKPNSIDFYKRVFLILSL